MSRPFAVRAAALSLLAACAGTAPRDFPPVEKLPARPEFPDPLVFLDGRPVRTADEWRERREELRALFVHYMYGPLLPRPEGPRPQVRAVFPDFFGGKATAKEVRIPLSKRPDGPALEMLLVLPNRRTGPAPVFVGHNFTGNHSLTADPRVTLCRSWMRPSREGVVGNRATEATRGRNVDSWALEQTIDRGYAAATFYYGDVFPDKPDFNDGVYPEYLPAAPGQTTPGEKGPGAIAMWAWGIHRAVDYLVTDPDVDARRIAAVGHSRLGKTALLAAAFDERIALAVPSQAGCGGTAPNRTRNPKAETVKVINKAFPHWFNDVFKKFGDQVERLPFDQHALVALCAPRPVLFANAQEDPWADPPGQFEILKAAEPVYRLLGAGGLEDREMPPLGKLSAGTLGYFIRAGKHSMTPEDWRAYLDFADRHLRGR